MRREQGRSLVEVLAVLSILGILSQDVADAWRQSVARTQARVTAAGLADAVRLARASSVSLRQPVTMCPGDGGDRCAGTWRGGVLVFADGNGNGRREAGENMLRHVHVAAERGSISWRSFRNRGWLQFRPLGHTAQQNGTFVYCPVSGNARHAAAVIVNKLGHARVARDRDGDGFVEMASGKPVTC